MCLNKKVRRTSATGIKRSTGALQYTIKTLKVQYARIGLFLNSYSKPVGGSMSHVAAVSDLAQLAMQLAVQTGRSEWYYEKVLAG